MLLKDNSDKTAGFNNLLRSVDKRGAHVVFEKLIVPGKNGILGNGNGISQIEELNIAIKRNVNFQSIGTTYGAKGGWTNLHVAVLAYDSLYQAIPLNDAAMVEDVVEGLGAGVGNSGASQAHITTASIASIGCEYTLYFKEA